MSIRKIREYKGESIIVRYDVRRCIHEEECVHGLPDVFNANRKPWIDADGASADEVERVVRQCPTGALQFERTDRAGKESPSEGNTARVGEDGPLYLSGDIEIVDYEHNLISCETRVALCRCGASQDKPFCDGSHTQAGFKDAGALSEDAKIGPPEGIGKIRIRLRPNGPLLFEGDLEICGKDQKVEAGRGAFCRCGASDRKPLCDGTHNKIEFQAD